jgi:hypothetical protein
MVQGQLSMADAITWFPILRLYTRHTASRIFAILLLVFRRGVLLAQLLLPFARQSRRLPLLQVGSLLSGC